MQPFHRDNCHCRYVVSTYVVRRRILPTASEPFDYSQSEYLQQTFYTLSHSHKLTHNTHRAKLIDHGCRSTCRHPNGCDAMVCEDSTSKTHGTHGCDTQIEKIQTEKPTPHFNTTLKTVERVNTVEIASEATLDLTGHIQSNIQSNTQKAKGRRQHPANNFVSGAEIRHVDDDIGLL